MCFSHVPHSRSQQQKKEDQRSFVDNRHNEEILYKVRERQVTTLVGPSVTVVY